MSKGTEKSTEKLKRTKTVPDRCVGMGGDRLRPGENLPDILRYIRISRM
jgi:hypothetical protein